MQSRNSSKTQKDAPPVAEGSAVAAAVQRDLDAVAKLDPKLAKSALAASALALAKEMDTPGNSATSKAMCAKTLLETLDRLRALAPAEEARDKLDELAERRVARRAAS